MNRLLARGIHPGRVQLIVAFWDRARFCSRAPTLVCVQVNDYKESRTEYLRTDNQAACRGFLFFTDGQGPDWCLALSIDNSVYGLQIHGAGERALLR